jgi:two-component system NtrC family sensor kinase
MLINSNNPKKRTSIVLLTLILVFSLSTLASGRQKVYQLSEDTSANLMGKYVSYLEDSSNAKTFEEVVASKNFKKVDKDIVNFQVSNSTFWMKFTIKNNTSRSEKILEVGQPLLEEAYLYCPLADGRFKLIKQGEKFPFKYRQFKQSMNFMFDLDLESGQQKTYYLKVRGYKQILVPLRVVEFENIAEDISTQTLWFGLYCGIVFVMFLYNLFIYFSIKDKSYIYYVLHTLFIGFTQASLLGFTYRYLWPDSPWFGNFAVFLFTCLVSIVGVQFLIEFMHIKRISLNIYRILKLSQLLYLSLLLSSFLGFYSTTFSLILFVQPIVAITIVSISVYLYKKGFAEAKYYLIGWSSLMLGIVIYVLKDYGILPYNTFTAYSILFGSAAEVTLLSFALADKINIYKKDKEESQEATLAALKENERIVLEQNTILEQRVISRTEELLETNHMLNVTLTELKEAQSQLVDSEKMAGLGQLTAGIAHEINNPINFVTSNIKPLELDILDLDTVIKMYEGLDPEAELQPQIAKIESFKKQIDIVFVREEIKSLLSGIGEGARRTAEIIRSLKNFSRLDENDTKPVDLNEGIASTLVLVKNTFPDHLQLVRDFGDLPLVECLPGKINQVFMNLITNAVHAIKSKEPKDSEGILAIKTWQEGTNVKVSIKDSGTGMPDDVKQKIFEPFFTTKDVGEGTGLGLSIVFRIIENHNGNIDVITNLNQGTEFIITLPINSK